MTDIAMTYMGKKTIEKNDKFKAEKSFPMPECGLPLGKLLDGIDGYICYRCENWVKEEMKRFGCIHSIWGSGADTSGCADG